MSIYCLLDVYKKWITSLFFFGYIDSAGKFEKGLFDPKLLPYLYIINGIGLCIGIFHIVRYFIDRPVATQMVNINKK